MTPMERTDHTIGKDFGAISGGPKKRCCKFAPSLLAPGQSKWPKLGSKLQSWAPFSKEWLGLQSQALFLVHLGLLTTLAFVAPKLLQTAETLNMKTKKTFPKQVKICGGKWPHRHCDVISGAKFAILKGYFRGQVCFFHKHHLSKKHYKNSGFSPFFNKKLRTQFVKG